MDEKELFEQRKSSIKEMIYDESYVPMKFKEISYLLGVPAEQKQELKEVLRALVEEGSVDITSKWKYIRPENRNLTGVFVSHPRGFGFVTVEGEPEDIFVPAEYVNGAFYKDRVLVRVKRREHATGKRPEGVILKILERGCKTVAGTFEKRDSYGFVRPDDSRCGQDIYISGRHSHRASDGDKVVVSMISYGTDKKKPEGEIIKVLGSIDDPAVDVASVIYAYGIEEGFSKAVMHEVKRVPRTVSAEECRGRKDLRDQLTVTIDGEDARDLDDAITLERLGDGYLLGVHIADVTHYVPEGSSLDQSALQRGTSVYLTDRVIPMLPKELSNGICSLNQGADRLTLSCIMHLDRKGNVLDHQIAETVIRVDRRMSYTGVQAILDGREHAEGEDKAVVKLCFLMQEAAALLKDKRRKRGAIEFDFPESKIITDDAGEVLDICPYERNTATDIIEDFMLLANETVAEDYFWQELPFVYRTHEAPEQERLRKLNVFIHNFGYYLRTERDIFHPKEIQKLLFSLEGEPEEALISRLALRSMQRAGYTTVNVGHFGLSTQYYTHFTSPIRRYPDLQIHRIIKENLHGRLTDRRITHYERLLPQVTDQCSRLERRAQDAERDVDKLKKIEYMQQRIGEHFTGVVSGVTSAGLYVELDNTVEGMIPVQSLLDDYYIFDEESYRLTGERTGRVFTLGQTVDIIVDKADKRRKIIDFSLEEFKPEGLSCEGDPESEADAGLSCEGEPKPESDDGLYCEGEPEPESDAELSYDEKTGIAINDWMSDDEAKRLLDLYSAKIDKKR